MEEFTLFQVKSGVPYPTLPIFIEMLQQLIEVTQFVQENLNMMISRLNQMCI